MASYIKRVLLPGEHVVHASTLHWVIYVQGLLITIAGGVVGYYARFVPDFLPGYGTGQQFTRPLALVALGIVLVGILMLLGAWIRQSSTELVVTNRRIIAKYGFIARMTYEIMINRVTGANFDQTVLGRLLGYGTIIVHGAGSDTSPIDDIENPQLFHRKLMAVLERWQNAERNVAPAPGTEIRTIE